MKRVAVVLLVLCAGVVGRTQPAAAPSSSLADFFKPGVVFQDRNGDGVIDFVDARVALPESPTAIELAAAADVAARLGFETTAMNFPLARVDRAGGGPDNASASATIFIGAKSLAGSGTTADAIGASGLKAGDGAVVAFTAGGKPAIGIFGGDDNGVSAAAVMLAGHLPYVWDQKGPTSDRIGDDVKQFLSGKNIAAVSASVPALWVRAGTDGVDRIVADVQLASAADLIKAQV